jgi:nicotinamide-nucleotide amidase
VADVTDLDDLAADVLEACRAAGLRVAAAESCTGGLVLGALTEIPGSSDVVERGFVTYSNEAKSELLGVSPGLIAAHGAVSEEVARAMADGALMRSRAHLAVAVTGVAGPGGSELKPEGLVCFGLAGRDVATVAQTVRFGALGRRLVRRASVAHALELLRDAARA